MKIEPLFLNLVCRLDEPFPSLLKLETSPEVVPTILTEVRRIRSQLVEPSLDEPVDLRVKSVVELGGSFLLFARQGSDRFPDVAAV